MPKGHFFTVTSGYGANTRKPFVELEQDGKRLAQVLPQEARALAYNLIAAAEAAEQDAFLVEWVEKTTEASLPEASMILHEYRKWREGKQP